MIIFGIIEIILSQIPNFHELSWLSAVAAVMSFGYSTIGLGLSIAKAVGGNQARTSLTGTTVGVDVTSWQKTWNCFEAIGDIAFAFAFSTVLVEIQASPPGFNGTLFLSGRLGHHHILRFMWCSGLRSIRQQHTRQFPNRVWLLRTVLAYRHG